MQQQLIDITGKSLPEIMRELVLVPAGMVESTYEQPLPPARYGDAATAYQSSGIPVEGGWHVYPEMTAAGLWTTPTDLARLALAVQQGLRGESDAVLDRSMMEQMLDRGTGGWGLGFQVRGEGESLSFEHGGSNAGFRAAFFALARSGQGAVIMTNSDTGGEILGRIMQTLSRLYEWPTEAFPLRKIEAVGVQRSLLNELEGSYSYAGGRYSMTFIRKGNRLCVDYVGGWQAEVFPVSESRWFVPADGTRLDFNRDDSGRFVSLTIDGRVRAVRDR